MHPGCHIDKHLEFVEGEERLNRDDEV